MNYPEYVLRRSETLWRELEEAWQRELTTATGVMRKRGIGTENAEEDAEGGNAVKRLAEKLFPAGSEASAEAVQRIAAQERETRDLAEASGASDARRESDSVRWFAEVSGVNSTLGGSGGARWLVDELGRGTTEGIAPERVQERTAGFAPVYETADLQSLSQSVERDARRYDGGFLLY